MTNTVLDILVIVLAVVGIIGIIKGIVKWALTPKNIDSVLILPFSGHHEDIELIIRNAATNTHFSKGNYNYNVICVDNGMDESTREICKKICNDYHFINLCGSNELSDLIKKFIS